MAKWALSEKHMNMYVDMFVVEKIQKCPKKAWHM